MTTSMNLSDYLSEHRRFVDSVLDEVLPSSDLDPKILHEAMRYSVFAGGKRIRPIIAIAAAQAVGGSRESVRYLTAALECIHTYSLIHDDLPAMDNDDMRRGKATAHKVFGEAVAILAGDALLTFAFEILTSPGSVRTCRPDVLLSALADLSAAAGSEKLVAGQVLDITCEGQDVPVSTVESIIKRKTGALIRASLTCGARLGGGSGPQIESLGRYGDYVGAVFQIRDDMLDLEGDAASLGKAVKKDSDRGKATLPKLLGKQKTVETMISMLGSALEEIKPFGENAEPLAMIAKYIGERLS